MNKEYKEAIKELAEEAELKLNKDYQKKELVLPHSGKLISKFAEEIAEIMKDKEDLFYRTETRDIVEINRIKLSDDKSVYNGFVQIKPNRFITLIEKFCSPGFYVLIKDEETKEEKWVFKEKSIFGDLANTLLQSHILHESVPRIDRIFTVPIPIIYKNKLTFPKRGYDKRFYSWLPYDAPTITNPNMSLEESKKVLLDLYKEFCFQNKQDYINAIAALLTPFLRGIYFKFNTRTPVFFYLANRERAGKDYCAGINGIVYEGYAVEESPINSSDNKKGSNSEELRKKILSAMIHGRKRMHFANNKGYINNSVFEAVTTAEKYSDRILGRNEIVSFDNELDFSLSGNVGVGFTPDLANRCRFIRLFLDIEDANARSFENPNLHNSVMENRNTILSALYALVNNWIDKGKPKGTLNFSSFPNWASVCGGVMEAAGYDSPCAPDKETLALGGDNETMEMKELFEIGYEKLPNEWITKQDIRGIAITSESNLFGYFDFDKRSDQTRFGNKINKFVGRVFSNIRLVVQDSKVRSSRQRFKFTKEIVNFDKKEVFGENFDGNVVTYGNLGNNSPLLGLGKKSNNSIYTKGHRVKIVAMDTIVTKKDLEKDPLFSKEDIEKSGLDHKLIEDTIKEIKDERVNN